MRSSYIFNVCVVSLSDELGGESIIILSACKHDIEVFVERCSTVYDLLLAERQQSGIT